jgi:hypothetical protein
MCFLPGSIPFIWASAALNTPGARENIQSREFFTTKDKENFYHIEHREQVGHREMLGVLCATCV